MAQINKIAAVYIGVSIIQDTMHSTVLYSIQLIFFCFLDVQLNACCHSAIWRRKSNAMPAFE